MQRYEVIAAASGTNLIQQYTGMNDLTYNLTYTGLNIASGVGQMAGKAYMNSPAGQAAKARADAKLIEVTRWGRPGLEPGDWVMRGGNSRWNYIRSGKWENKPDIIGTITKFFGSTNDYAARSTGQTYLVPRSSLGRPTGWSMDGWFNTLLGQCKYLP